MNQAHLIKMANQIGTFFEAMPDREQAVADVATHFKRTWDPRMRMELLEVLCGANEATLKTLVRDALIALRQLDSA